MLGWEPWRNRVDVERDKKREDRRGRTTETAEGGLVEGKDKGLRRMEWIIKKTKQWEDEEER